MFIIQPTAGWVPFLTHIPHLPGRASSLLWLEPGGLVLLRCNTSTQDTSTSMCLVAGHGNAFLWYLLSLCHWWTPCKTIHLTLHSWTPQHLSRLWLNFSLWERATSATTLQWSERFVENSVKSSGKRPQGQEFGQPPSPHSLQRGRTKQKARKASHKENMAVTIAADCCSLDEIRAVEFLRWAGSLGSRTALHQMQCTAKRWKRNNFSQWIGLNNSSSFTQGDKPKK